VEALLQEGCHDASRGPQLPFGPVELVPGFGLGPGALGPAEEEAHIVVAAVVEAAAGVEAVLEAGFETVAVVPHEDADDGDDGGGDALLASDFEHRE
jgi:hypothetical protein